MRGAFLDIVAFAGLGLFCVGVHQVYPPAAFIAGGLLTTGIAVALVRSKP